jgi:hypothetical protein
LSIAASADRFDMLIFHEDNAAIMNMSCAANVQKINVHKHGLARLITAAICQAPRHITTFQKPPPGFRKVKRNGNQSCTVMLGEALENVIQEIPFYLCEYKIGVSPLIFQNKYLLMRCVSSLTFCAIHMNS